MTENNNRSLKPEYPEVFYPRILGKVVINAITDEFYTTLQNYAGDDLASDGPFLLWLILSHFHSSKYNYIPGKIEAPSMATILDCWPQWRHWTLFDLAQTSAQPLFLAQSTTWISWIPSSLSLWARKAPGCVISLKISISPIIQRSAPSHLWP